MTPDRVEILANLVNQDPSNSRTRYMLAMELINRGDLEGAKQQFDSIFSSDPDYVAAYYHCGQALEKLGRTAEARETYQRGIDACARTGNDHTRSELEGVLDALTGS